MRWKSRCTPTRSPGTPPAGRESFPSADGAGNLFADTSQIADPDGLRYLKFDGTPGDGGSGNGSETNSFSYQWTRVDAVTAAETDIGGSPTYLPR